MTKLTYVYAFLFATLLLVALLLFVLNQLGYEFNKNYLTFDRDQCIAENYETKIQGCVFWSRNDQLERVQGWKSEFESQSDECVNFPDADGISFVKTEKCDYIKFMEAKRKQNWDYLISTEKDDIYNSCADNFCPKEPLFK